VNASVSICFYIQQHIEPHHFQPSTYTSKETTREVNHPKI